MVVRHHKPFGTISYCSIPAYCQVSTKIMQPISWASISYTVQKRKSEAFKHYVCDNCSKRAILYRVLEKNIIRLFLE